MDDSRLTALLDKQEIAEVILQVARALDRCDEVALRRCFHEDATDDHGIFKGTARDFIPWVMDMLGGMTATMHFIGNILIELTARDAAKAESYFTAYHRVGAAGAEQDVVVAGRYLDRFVRAGDGWALMHRHAVYDWTTTQPASDESWRQPPMLGLLARGDRGAADPSAFDHKKP